MKKFDFIIGNPPYQEGDGGGTGDSATPLYNLFVEQSKLNVNKGFTMVMPSKWFKGGKGLDKFRQDMLEDTHIKAIVDFEDANSCFPNVNIDGGVNYLLWAKEHDGMVDYTYVPKGKAPIISKRYLKNDYSDNVIRDYRQISIIGKAKQYNEELFSSIVSVRKPYGINTDLFNAPEKYPQSDLHFDKHDGYLRIYGVKGKKGGAKRIVGYVNPCFVSRQNDSVEKYKLIFPKAYSQGVTILPEIIIGLPNDICTETFLQVGSFNTEQEVLNCLSYVKTKFFRALLTFNRGSFILSQQTFDLIPLQLFTKSWTDKELYDKYNLTNEEINYIEINVDDME